VSPIKATTYYVIAEALTNVKKHAGARRVEVGATTDDETRLVEVSDDGVGGAHPEGNGQSQVPSSASSLNVGTSLVPGAGMAYAAYPGWSLPGRALGPAA
jgi:anti-sigma regulatory factor (Ser/Thr protein kinase)